MANRTLKDVKSIHQTNPQYLIERIIRGRIYESRFWKEDCFGINEESLVDKSTELKYVGGIYGGNIKPTPFLCLILKMLQIQPHMDIIIEFIKQTHFKYARALSAYYLRLTANSLDVYKYLEPLYNDYRKLRYIDRMGKFSIIHMDEFIDMLLREDRVFDVILPRISARRVHEENGELEPRISLLGEELDDESEEEKDHEPQELNIKKNEKNIRDDETSRNRKHSSERELAEDKRRKRRDREWDQDRDRDRGRDREKDRDRGRDRDRDRGRDRDRDRDRTKYDRYSDHSHRDDRSSTKRRDRSNDRHKDEGRPKRDSEREKAGKSSGGKTYQDEIDEANALRAKLGLAPLKP